MTCTQGFSAVELYTNEKMTKNLQPYPYLGYREIGRWEEDGFNRVFFKKELSELLPHGSIPGAVPARRLVIFPWHLLNILAKIDIL